MLKMFTILITFQLIAVSVWAGPAGDEALHEAASNLDVDAVKAALEKGANPNAVLQPRNRTPLQAVAYGGYFTSESRDIANSRALEVVEILFAKGARLSVHSAERRPGIVQYPGVPSPVPIESGGEQIAAAGVRLLTIQQRLQDQQDDLDLFRTITETETELQQRRLDLSADQQYETHAERFQKLAKEVMYRKMETLRGPVAVAYQAQTERRIVQMGAEVEVEATKRIAERQQVDTRRAIDSSATQWATTESPEERTIIEQNTLGLIKRMIQDPKTQDMMIEQWKALGKAKLKAVVEERIGKNAAEADRELLAGKYDDRLDKAVVVDLRNSAKRQIQVNLVEAASMGNVEAMKMAVKAGADINGRDPAHKIALVEAIMHHASYSRRHAEAVWWLLDAGADPNARGKSEFSDLGIEGVPLHMFVSLSANAFNSPKSEERALAEKILTRLLRAGAKVSGMDSKSRTPLHIAAKFDNVRAAELLIRAGARVMARDEKGRTPLDYAESASMIQLLKKHGATER